MKLVQLASSHKEAEVALQKAKAKREQEVEVWIQKYDDDLGAKEKEYQDELMVFNQINAQLQVEHLTFLRQMVFSTRTKILCR